MAFGGTSERLAFILSLDANGAIQGFRNVGNTAERELGRADDRLDRIGSRMQVFGAGALATAGVVGTALVGMAQQSEEANRSQLLLQNTLDNIPTLAGETVDAFNEQADAIQRVTAADGDAVVAAQAMLGTFRLTGDEIRGITPLVVDYARKFQVDLTDAAIQVGKALDGQSGALRRNGVSIDAALFATDRYAAVQQALSEQVGGFAEQEGATFAGSIERLKNQIGDLAEGVGAGAVDAFSDFIGVAQVGIGVVDGLGAGAQAGIGKFATYAAATTGVVGALSVLGGTALRARDRFTTLGDDGVRSMNRLGRAASGVALAGLVTGLIQASDATSHITFSIEELNRGLEENERQTAANAVEIAGFVGGFDDLARTIADQSVPAADRLLESLTANREELGLSQDQLDEYAEALQNKRDADVQGAVDQRNYAGEVDAAAEATGELEDSTRGATDATRRNTDAIRDNERAIEDLVKAREDALSNDLDLQQAMIDSARALEDYNDTLRDNESTELDRQEAGIALIRTYLEQGEAARQNAEDEARAAGDAAHAVERGRDAQIAALLDVAQNLAPGSYLRNQLDSYIWSLANEIPTDLTTRVHLDLSELNDLQAQTPNVRIPIASTTDLNAVTGGSTVNITINGVGHEEVAREVERSITWATRI